MLFFAFLLFIVRLIIAQTSDFSGRSTLQLIALLAFIYFLFLLEGLQHCAIQITDADHDGINDVLAKSVGGRKRRSTDSMIDTFRSKSKFELFLTGRNMCSMISIVMIAFILDHMPFSEPSEANVFYSFVDTNSHWPHIHTIFSPLLHNFITLFVLSTLLPCWIAQLLPQILAGKHSVEFMQMPAARLATGIAISVARLETGRPSEFLHAGVRRFFGKFTEPERFAVGKAAMFDRQAESLGMSVEERTIAIEAHADRLAVYDRCTLAYRGAGVSTIRHSLQLVPPPKGNVTLDDWGFEFPDWITTYDQPTARLLAITTSQGLEQINANNRAPEGDISPDLVLSPLSHYLVVSFEANIENEIPRDPDKPESVSVRANFVQSPLEIDPDPDSEAFYITISKPTRSLTVEIKTFDKIFVKRPTVSFVFIDEPSGLGFDDTQARDVAPENVQPHKGDGGGWIIKIDFPPLNSQFKIVLNAYRRAASPSDSKPLPNATDPDSP